MSALSTSPLVKRYTHEEFSNLAFPDTPFVYELIAGVLYMKPRQMSGHARIYSNLCRALRQSLGKGTGLMLIPHLCLKCEPATFLMPELMVVNTKGSDRETRIPPISSSDSAELVAEIVLPLSSIYYRYTKADTYAALNVKELWLIDPEEKNVEVRNLRSTALHYETGAFFRSGEQIRSEVVKGLTLLVDNILGNQQPL